MAGVTFREAGVEDAHDIDALLVRLAPEIPLFVDTLARQEALYALIRRCARTGASWIAFDEAERVIGFVLVEPNETRRHYAEHEVLDLHYAGVAPEHRGQGIFRLLVSKVLARMAPVNATVHAQNKSGAARRLEGFGFRDTGA